MLKMILLPVLILLFVSVPAHIFAGELGSMSDAAEDFSDMIRAADRAADNLEDLKSSRHHGKGKYVYDAHEKRRVSEMARETGQSEREIRNLRRDGYSWDEISRHHSPAHGRYERWSKKGGGMPPGLAKKGGVPRGQAKKNPGWKYKD